MAVNTDNLKSPGLFSAIAIGVGCIIRSGWLFASYNAARAVGSMAFVSWIIGAILALVLALLIAETATMFKERAFKMPCGLILSYLIFLAVSYLMIQASVTAIVLALIVHVVLFIVYVVSYYKKDVSKILKSLYSSWSIFLYLIISVPFSYLIDTHQFSNIYSILLFLILYTISYFSMVHQKNYQN